MARLSVCLTHYNRPAKLAATLESLAAQTRPPDEIFLRDDCSPNDPTEVARRFAGRFPHFVYHRNERNLNMPANLNAVIGQATGDLVANLHDADTFDPTLLEKWERALTAHPTAGLVFCGVDARGDSGDESGICLHPLEPLTPGREFFETHYVGHSSSMIWGTVMVRRSLYDRLLPFDATYRNWADVDMWMRIALEADVAYVREPLIRLDHTDTPLRRFTWYRILVMQAMVLRNIERAYASDPVALSRQLRRQRAVIRRRLVRHLIAAVPRGDWSRWKSIRPVFRAAWAGRVGAGELETLWRTELATRS